jgi:hypothetical protein
MKKVGISLGNVCYSAHWGHSAGLVEKAKGIPFYKHTCPFDLMISNYNGVVKCIEDDFAHFTDSQYLQRGNVLLNTYYGFGYNHEFVDPNHDNVKLHLKENWPTGSEHFVNNDYFYFKERYATRIQNFRNLISDPNNYIVFIIQFKNEPMPDPELQALRNALQTKYPDLKYEFLILPSGQNARNHTPETEEQRQARQEQKRQEKQEQKRQEKQEQKRQREMKAKMQAQTLRRKHRKTLKQG